MPGGEERALRQRIKSVQSTKKITRAMEMISASRIVKAQQRVAAARPYSEQITKVVRNLAAAGAGGDQPLLTPREVSNVGVIVLAADRGLAGGYNSAVIRQAEKALHDAEDAGHGTQLFAVGGKAVSYFRYRGREVAASFTGFTDAPSYEDARRIAKEVVDRFQAGDLDRVELAYTRFVSIGTQRPTLTRFVPLDPEALEGGDGAKKEKEKEKDAQKGPQADYEFEPGAGEILERLLPRYVESRLFSALLEAAASEHAARQRAMKSATDNATELAKTLDRKMNRARQDSITTEIIEIASGAEALNKSDDGGGNTSGDYFAERDATPYDANAS